MQCDECTFTGDAAYVAANHRTHLPLLLLAGMLIAVLLIYTLLFRRLKPYHTVQQNKDHGDANGDVVELVTTNHIHEQQEAAAEVASL